MVDSNIKRHPTLDLQTSKNKLSYRYGNEDIPFVINFDMNLVQVWVSVGSGRFWEIHQRNLYRTDEDDLNQYFRQILIDHEDFNMNVGNVVIKFQNRNMQDPNKSYEIIRNIAIKHIFNDTPELTRISFKTMMNKIFEHDEFTDETMTGRYIIENMDKTEFPKYLKFSTLYWLPLRVRKFTD